jgi:hypothetical protein
MKIPDNISDRLRRQANTINSLVVSGRLDPKDIDKLMIHGVDLGSILVYKKYFRKGGQNGRHKHRGQ